MAQMTLSEIQNNDTYDVLWDHGVTSLVITHSEPVIDPQCY